MDLRGKEGHVGSCAFMEQELIQNLSPLVSNSLSCSDHILSVSLATRQAQGQNESGNTGVSTECGFVYILLGVYGAPNTDVRHCLVFSPSRSYIL